MASAKYFKPSDGLLATLPMRERQQLDYVVVGDITFILVFLLLTIGMFVQKIPLAGVLCLLDVITFVVSLLLIRKDKIYLSSGFASAGILASVAIILFSAGDASSSLVFYRNACFIVTMTVCNQLVSIRKKGIRVYAFGSLMLWILSVLTLLKAHLATNAFGTVSAIVICTMSVILTNTVSIILNKFNQRLVSTATNSEAKANESLKSITNVIAESKNGLEVGERLYVATQDATDNIEQLSTIFREVADSADMLGSETKTINDASEHVKEQSVQMLESVQIQNDSIGITSRAMDEMSNSLASMTEIANRHKAKMSKIEGNLDAQMKLIEKLVNEVEKVQTSSETIGGFVNTVNNIAARTGLLAMNASIEAAHAGEAGKGFSVIAQEIRKLSNNTTENAARITDGLEDNTAIVNETSESVATFQEFTKNTTVEIRETIEGIEEILAGILSINEETQKVMNSLQTVIEHSQKSNDMVNMVVAEIDRQDEALDKMAGIATTLQENVQGMDSHVKGIKSVIESIEREAVTNVDVTKKITASLDS